MATIQNQENFQCINLTLNMVWKIQLFEHCTQYSLMDLHHHLLVKDCHQWLYSLVQFRLTLIVLSVCVCVYVFDNEL